MGLIARDIAEALAGVATHATLATGGWVPHKRRADSLLSTRTRTHWPGTPASKQLAARTPSLTETRKDDR